MIDNNVGREYRIAGPYGWSIKGVADACVRDMEIMSTGMPKLYLCIAAILIILSFFSYNYH